MNFSIILRMYLKEKNIKLIELANLLGISRQTLNSSLKRWEVTEPTLKTIKKISKVLNESPSLFINKLKL
ncbi:MAG: helix-turn-helix domain-containing protein [Cetobacterium sp.]|uniref:helix-turn-helix domain-containing protein n=1 Tax=unclassified Cetobacterium TaxID=2630983 RepID=UPI000648B6C0|nr:helix-turn-helix transcriptional regulator [Cetobacterium sp. ZWU0022]